MTDEQFAIYTAGFFDGEGTITVTRGGLGGRAEAATRQFIIIIAISNTNYEILEKHRRYYGGTLPRMRPARTHRKPCWKWMLRNASAIAFLKTIRPYLMIKAEEADIAFELNDRIKSFKPQYRKIRWGGMLPLPEEEIAARQAIVDRLKAHPNRRWSALNSAVIESVKMTTTN